jgi:hypothetical protein
MSDISVQINPPASIPVTIGVGVTAHAPTHAPDAYDSLVAYYATTGSLAYVSGLTTGIGNTGYLTGYVSKSETGDFYPISNPSGFITGVDLSNYVTGQVVRPSETGSFITNSQTGAFYAASNPSGFITGVDLSAYVTGAVVRPSETGSFITNSQTGQFVGDGETGAFLTTGAADNRYALQSSTGLFVTSGQTGNFVTSSSTGAFLTTGAADERYALQSATGNFVTTAQTGNFVTGSVVRPTETGAFLTTGAADNRYALQSATGVFVTTGSTGSFVTTSQTGQFVSTGATGNFVTGSVVRPSETGNFIVSSQTGQFVGTGSTGSFVTSSSTGAFLTTGAADNRYALQSATGSFVTTGQTGNFVINSQTGAFLTTGAADARYYGLNNGQSISGYATTGFNDALTGITVTGVSTKTITLFQRDGSTLTADFTDGGGPTDTGYLTGYVLKTETGQFYPTSNPSGYITGVDLSAYATTGYVTGVSGYLQNQINNFSGSSSTGAYVSLTGNQDISGLKDFQTRPTVLDVPVLLSGEAVDTIHLYGKNDQGTTIYKGQPVYIGGANGSNPLIKLASNTGERTSSKTIGLLAQDLPVNEFGYIITEGILEGFDTSSGVAGDPMWLGPTGNIIYGIVNKPYGNNHLVYLGIVLRSNNSNGKVYVKVQNGFEIDELHQVYALNPSDKDSLLYNSGSGAWFARQITTGDVSGITNYTLKSETGSFITTSQTGQFVGDSETGAFLTTGAADNRYALQSATGSFITVSQTGQFVSTGATGNFVTSSQTGAFLTTGAADSRYYSLSNGQSISGYAVSGHNNSITGIAVTGDTTKTITLYERDGSTISASFTDNAGTGGGGGGGTSILGIDYLRWQIVGLSSTGVYSITGANSNESEAYRVTINAAIQDPAEYTVNGTADTIAFSSNPPENSDIIVIETIPQSVSGIAGTMFRADASEFIPTTTSGCGIDSQETTTYDINRDFLTFADTVDSSAMFWFNWPAGWATAKTSFFWNAPTATGSVVWSAAMRVFTDGDSTDLALGSAQTVTDAVESANTVRQSSATSGITPSGTISAGKRTVLKVSRLASSNVSDDMAAIAYLEGVLIEKAS